MNPDTPPLVPYFDAPTFARATSVFLGGTCRLALNHLAFECASRINENFLWLEVRRPGVPSDPQDPATSGRIPARRVLVAVPPVTSIRPETKERPRPIVVRRSEGAREELGQLADFLRIPHFLQSLFPRLSSGGRPNVFVMVNSDEIVNIYPDSLEQTRAFLQVFRQEKVTLVVAYCGTPPTARFAFDYVFGVSTPDSPQWRTSTVRCEQSPKSAPFPAGSPRPVFGPD